MNTVRKIQRGNKSPTESFAGSHSCYTVGKNQQCHSSEFPESFHEVEFRSNGIIDKGNIKTL